MGEARRKLAGTYPAQSQPLSRADAITWAMGFLATTEDETVSGVSSRYVQNAVTRDHADSLASTRELLLSGLVRSERQPVDPPEVVEIWFAG